MRALGLLLDEHLTWPDAVVLVVFLIVAGIVAGVYFWRVLD